MPPKKRIQKKDLRSDNSVKDNSKYHFFEDVYAIVRLIPEGRVTSYGSIAAYLGSKSSSRMVGWAMNLSHHTKPVVPAHRVVNRMGMLSGKHHFETPTTMETLLQKEGHQIEKDTIIYFDRVFWDPAKELEELL